MPSKRAIEEANRRGGYLDISDNDKPWKNLFNFIYKKGKESIKEALKNFIDEKVTIDLVFYNSKKFNAFVLKDERKCIIGLSGAVIPNILHVAKFTLSHEANFFGRNHNYIGPDPNNNSIDFLINDPDLYKFSEDNNLQSNIISVINMAIDILISHELCHLINGHIGWQKEQVDLNFMSEANPKDSKIPFIIRQTLEWDADTVGISRAFLRALGVTLPDVCGLNYMYRLNLPSYNTHGTSQQAIYLFKIAIMVLFSCMDRERVSCGVNNSYPTPKMRRTYAMSMSDHVFSTRIIPLIDNKSDLFNLYWGPSSSAILRFEKAWTFIFGHHISFREKPDFEFINSLNAYKSEFSKLSPHLYNHIMAPSAWDAF
ncbi:hypothetical protein [Paracoccus sp. Ld10]|uniref:hypothetical protein n=1 Tax=Paracoccus sp. Ld10 TaxID=649158 RepID=UPI003863FEF0